NPGSVVHRPRRQSRHGLFMSASQASALLLDVRTANCCRWNRAADHACDRDQGQCVREDVEELRNRAAGREVGGQVVAEGAGGPEEQSRGEGAEWTPIAEEQCGEGE